MRRVCWPGRPMVVGVLSGAKAQIIVCLLLVGLSPPPSIDTAPNAVPTNCEAEY